MHRMLMTAAALAALATVAAVNRAEAFPIGALPAADPAQKVAICFYVDGWHGPGFYQCGYRLRTGEGWVREREERRERFERRERREDRREDRRERGDRDYGGR
jgi:hypothetical protein